MRSSGRLIACVSVLALTMASGVFVSPKAHAVVVCQNKKNPKKLKLRATACRKSEIVALDLAECCASAALSCVGTVPSDHPLFPRFEAPAYANACAQNTECVVGGCSGEICAAESLISTCEALSQHPAGQCGCVDGQCIWNKCE